MFSKIFVGIFLAFFAIASSVQASEENEIHGSTSKTLPVAPLVAAALLKPLFVKPLIQPLVAGAAAGAIGGSIAAAKPGLTIEIDEHGAVNASISRTISCGEVKGNPCYLLPSGCYCPVPMQKPWNEAFSICRSSGKRLLSIESLAKQIEMQLYLPQILSSNTIYEQVGFWTSGAYCVTAFTWTARPEYFTYTNWLASSEPTITGFSNGACVRSVPTSSYQWDDIDCSQFLPFICES